MFDRKGERVTLAVLRTCLVLFMAVVPVYYCNFQKNKYRKVIGKIPYTLETECKDFGMLNKIVFT